MAHAPNPILVAKHAVASAVEHRGPLALARAAHERWAAGSDVVREGYPRCFIGLCLDGVAVVHSGERRTHLTAGTVLLMQRGGSYRIVVERELELLVAVADGEASHRLCAACFEPDDAVLPVADPVLVEALLRQLLAVLAAAGPHPLELVEGCVDLALRHLHRSGLEVHAAATGSRATFLACRRVLEEHACELRGVADAAARCHVDRAYLARLFQRYAHCAPGAYLTRLKMQRASDALLGGAGVAQAAEAAGYGDAFTFSKAFRRHFGEAPSRWQRTQLEA